MAQSALPLRLVPRSVHPAPEPHGLYFRVGRNDYRDTLDLITGGETGFFGVVCDPTYAKYQKELVERALERRLDVILDPRTQASATIGGFSTKLGELPWGRERVHVPDDFKGAAGRRLISGLARFVADHGYTQVLSPSHLLRSVADDWWEIDLWCARELREELERINCSRVSVLYSLAISYAMFRDAVQRRTLVRGLKGIPAEGIWLAIDGIGSNSTPAAVRTYLEGVSDFHTLELPLIADHSGGLVGLAFVAFGGVGGLAHGVTLGERFDTAHWHRPRGEVSFGMPPRVYFPTLDLLLRPSEADALFGFGRRAVALFGCRDSRCCPRGVTDMLQNPEHHFLRRRIDEVAQLSAIPPSLRAGRFVDQRLRPTTDAVLAATKFEWQDPALAKRMNAQRVRLDRMRMTLADLAQETNEARTVAVIPPRRIVRTPPQRPSMSP